MLLLQRWAILLVAAFAESAAVDAAVDEVSQLVSVGGNDFHSPRKMMNVVQGRSDYFIIRPLI